MHTVLAATSATLRQMLLDSMTSDAGPNALASFFSDTATVSLDAPDEMVASAREGLSLWLYRVAPGDVLRTPPREVRTLPTGEGTIPPPPLDLRLDYLLTPIAQAGAELEQRILGRAMQLFYTAPVIKGASLLAELAGTAAALRVTLQPLSLEEITRVWAALRTPYRLSVSYEVRLEGINSAEPL
jgi:hypothetical protein